MSFKDGISIIVPVYKGKEYISTLLNSLKSQTLDCNLFEAIFVFNGEEDGSIDILKEFINDNPKLNIKVLHSEKGVSNARNLALENLSFKYCIFIDIDDYISSNYLEVLYKYSAPNRVVLGSFYNVDFEGNLSKTYFTDTILEHNGPSKLYDFSLAPFMITTNKLLPSNYANQIKFNSDLNNGVDLDYFFSFYSHFDDVEFYIVANDYKAIYYRLVVPGSISRQDLSFQFNVIDRLKVMKSVENTFKKLNKENMRKLMIHIYSGQTKFLSQYIINKPDEYCRVIDEIDSFNIENFDYYILKDYLKSENIEISGNINDLSKYSIDKRILERENKKLKSEIDFYNKLLETKPYRFAGFIRRIAKRLRSFKNQ